MITKEDLRQVIGNAEVGKNLRLTFPKSCLSVDTLTLKSFLGMTSAGVIEINIFQRIRLLGAIQGDGWRGEPIFEVAIGPHFAEFNRQTFEMILIGCLEKIEVM